VIGLYILLADNDHEGFEDTAVWEPRLYEYQQKAANVLFFTFLHPVTMDVPPAFSNLAKTRGTNVPGAVPADTVMLFAIGKYDKLKSRQLLAASTECSAGSNDHFVVVLQSRNLATRRNNHATLQSTITQPFNATITQPCNAAITQPCNA
jgi:hypothetical protein